VIKCSGGSARQRTPIVTPVFAEPLLILDRSDKENTLSTTYDFRTQLATGEEAERRLDAWFAHWYAIEPATMDQQRQGIDRIFTRRDTGRAFKVEYKTDSRASATGNAFVETVSVDTTGKAGWAYTSQADMLLYYVPVSEVIYVIQMTSLRRHLPRWQQQYPARRIPNQGYCTHGLLVPLDEFERIAQRVESI